MFLFGLYTHFYIVDKSEKAHFKMQRIRYFASSNFGVILLQSRAVPSNITLKLKYASKNKKENKKPNEKKLRG